MTTIEKLDQQIEELKKQKEVEELKIEIEKIKKTKIEETVIERKIVYKEVPFYPCYPLDLGWDRTTFTNDSTTYYNA